MVDCVGQKVGVNQHLVGRLESGVGLEEHVAGHLRSVLSSV